MGLYTYGLRAPKPLPVLIPSFIFPPERVSSCKWVNYSGVIRQGPGPGGV